MKNRHPKTGQISLSVIQELTNLSKVTVGLVNLRGLTS